jgi:hypothetical protein
MKINTKPFNVKIKSDLVYKTNEIRYALLNFNNDTFLYTSIANNLISVLWTETEFDNYKKESNTKDWLNQLNQERTTEIERIKKLKFKESLYIKNTKENKINYKLEKESKINFLENHKIILIKITFLE